MVGGGGIMVGGGGGMFYLLAFRVFSWGLVKELYFGKPADDAMPMIEPCIATQEVQSVLSMQPMMQMQPIQPETQPMPPTKQPMPAAMQPMPAAMQPMPPARQPMPLAMQPMPLVNTAPTSGRGYQRMREEDVENVA